MTINDKMTDLLAKHSITQKTLEDRLNQIDGFDWHCDGLLIELIDSLMMERKLGKMNFDLFCDHWDEIEFSIDEAHARFFVAVQVASLCEELFETFWDELNGLLEDFHE